VKAKVLITGAGGILGTELQRWAPQGRILVPLTRADLDVEQRSAVRDVLEAERPEHVIHCAAMTAVDACESEPDRAYRANGVAPGYLAEACAAVGATLVHLSTDYVFDGEKGAPYLEDDPTRPLSVYGASKRWGEEVVRRRCPRHYILRTQWVYGAAGRNFVDTMLDLAGAGKEIKVVGDQVGCPTFAGDLAAAIYRILAADPGSGTYHVSAGGQASWYEFAAEIFRQAGLAPALCPCTTDEFPRPARRPRNGVLRNYHLELTMGDPMPDWKAGLRAYLGQIGRASGGAT
jgi:dTDP-4-dehydrorhamnose reductase